MPLKRSTKQLIVGKASAWIFLADFTKGFDLIDHSILMQELANLEVSSCTPSLDCGVLDKPEAGSLNRGNFIRLVNSKRRSAPRDQIKYNPLYGDD